MIGVLAVTGVVGVTAAAGIGSLINDFDGICTSFKIKSFTSLLLLDGVNAGAEEIRKEKKNYFHYDGKLNVLRTHLTLTHN